MLKLVEKLNKNHKPKHFDSFDFASLYTNYTNIPHNLLLHSLNVLITEAFRIRSAEFISVGYGSRHKDVLHVTATKLIEYITLY